MPQILECEQGSEAWHQARLGSLGASRLHEAVARTKTGWGASRDNVMADLIIEKLTGKPTEAFVSRFMLHGIETEPEAREAYKFYRGSDVREVGLARHSSIQGTHASPDGVVGDEGLLEIKCCAPATHLSALLGESLPDKYVVQALWQMACMERGWCDVAYYNPAFPEEMQLLIRRVHRDNRRIGELEGLVELFLEEMETKLAKLQRFGKAA